ncbi:MAG: hypothetical protein ACR2L6_00735 [Gemmatimonadaceae bacterium]
MALIAIAIVMAMLLGAGALAVGRYMDHQFGNLPTVRGTVDRAAFAVGEPVTGILTISSTDAATITGPVEVAIFPRGVRQDDTNLIATVGVDGPRNLSLDTVVELPFIWDQKTRDGAAVQPGTYALAIRLRAQVDRSDARVGGMTLHQVDITIR